MDRTENLKELARELNERFKPGTVIKKTSNGNYCQEHPECFMLLGEFNYCPETPVGDERIGYNYANLDLILAGVYSLSNFLCYDRLYNTNEYTFEKASEEDIENCAKAEMDHKIKNIKKDIANLKNEIVKMKKKKMMTNKTTIKETVLKIKNLALKDRNEGNEIRQRY